MIVRRQKRGLTLAEVMIASALSVIVGAGIFAVLNMVSSFTRQGFAETRQLNQTAIAVETISRILNHAYRLDASTASFAPVISGDNRTVTFTIPINPTTNQTRRFRFDDASDTLHYEVEAGGVFSEFSGAELLSDVDDFFIINQEGIMSFVISVFVDMGVNGQKRYTMVGRALPRNI